MKFLHHSATLLLSIALMTLIGCASTSTQTSTGEFIDDSVITTRVKAAIFNDPDLKVAQINVETFKNVVQLSGFVDDRATVNKAGMVATGVTGVQSVRNDLIIK